MKVSIFTAEKSLLLADMFKPYESELNKALHPTVRFMGQPVLKKKTQLSSKRKLPLILPEPTPAREPLSMDVK